MHFASAKWFDRVLAFLALVTLLVAGPLGCSLTSTYPTSNNLGISARDQLDPESSLTDPDRRMASVPSDTDSGTIQSLGRELVDDATYVLTSPLRMDWESALIVGGVGVGIGGFIFVDEDLQDFAQRSRTDGGDKASQVMEDIGSAYAVFGGNVALLGLGWWFRDDEAGDKLLQTALVSLEAQLFTETIAGFTKFAVGRSRPSKGQGAHFYRPFHNFDFDRTFPSSHTARAFAVATVFADRYDQPVPLIAYSAATAMGLTRIFLNDHFASDVFAGAALGITLGKVLSLRHSRPESGLAFLPYLPGDEGSLGLSLQYTF